MKRIILITIAAWCVTPLLLGQAVCPEQVFIDPNTCPAELSPGDLVTDPASGQVLYLGSITQEIGKPWTWDGYSCTEEANHEIRFSASAGELWQSSDPNTGIGLYTLTGIVQSVGPTTITITAHVVPHADEVSTTRAGGLVIIGTPRVLPAPPLCAGRP